MSLSSQTRHNECPQCLQCELNSNKERRNSLFPGAGGDIGRRGNYERILRVGGGGRERAWALTLGYIGTSEGRDIGTLAP